MTAPGPVNTTMIQRAARIPKRLPFSRSSVPGSAPSLVSVLRDWLYRFLLVVAATLVCLPAHADYATECSGCHGVAPPPFNASPYDRIMNAANKATLIDYAIANVPAMIGMSTTNQATIAAFLGGLIPSFQVATQNTAYVTATTFSVSYPQLNTTAGTFTGLQTGATAPQYGTVSYSGNSITYTPNVGQASKSDTFTYQAVGPGGRVSTDWPVTVNIGAAPIPTITSAGTASGTGGSAFSYQITTQAGDGPTGYSVLGTLPPGVSVDTSTGLISGTLTQSGTFNVTVRATNPGGTGTKALAITIAPTVPVFTSANSASGTGGQAFSFQLAATYFPTSFSLVSGTLPSGVSLDTSTGLISGTPTQSGTFNVTVGATNGIGTGTQALTITIGLVTPVITSSASASGLGGQAFAYLITASNLPSSFGVIGTLPNGVTVNPTTGLISGTPTESGTFNVTVTATNTAGTGSQALAITISLLTPVITSSVTASGTGGTAFSYQITANNLPSSFGVTGTLPPGVSVNPTTGLISGTPTQSGTFNVTVTATNTAGTGSQALAITIAASIPVFTSATTASCTGGQACSFQLTASYFPTSFSLVSGSLPAGLSLSTATGLISGTPTVGGSFPVTVGATNGVGTGTQALTINVALAAPVITSPATATGTGGQAFSYQITASNLPSSFGVTGSLPSGLSVNPSTGLISGTPTQSGSFVVTISATNGAGTGTQSLTITIGLVTPVITSAATASGTGGQAFSYQITASNLPSSFGVTGTLPTGVTVNPTTGLISGTPTQSGTFNVTVTATNAAGTGSQGLTITIGLAIPVITSSASASGTGGAAFTYQITATNLPSSYGVTGTLPPGVSVNPATGLISGTPTQSGTFNVTVTATNAAGTGSQALFITIAPSLPVFTSASTASCTGGQACSFQLTAAYFPTSFSLVSGSLPPGLTLNTATGLISGTPTAGGSFPVTVGATNGVGTGTQALTITVSLVTPVVTSAATASGSTGQAFSYQITATNLPSSYGVTGTLPSGLTLNPATGLISGTPAAAAGGLFTVTVSATNTAGTGTKSVTLTIDFSAPTVADKAVAAVSGQALAIDLTASITGSFASIAVASGPAHGSVSVSGAVVTYTSAGAYVGADSFTYTATSPAPGALTSAAATVTITVAAQGTTAGPVSLTVPLNTATTVDLTPYITGTLITGVSIGQQPGHGSLTLNGKQVTYTPNHDYFGADSFTYIAHGAGGASAAATVSITVVGRPDPRQDASLTRMLKAQLDAAKRFVAAPLTNFQQRLESLHGRTSPTPGNGTSAAPVPSVRPNEPQAFGEVQPVPRSAPIVNLSLGGGRTQAATLPVGGLMAMPPPGQVGFPPSQPVGTPAGPADAFGPPTTLQPNSAQSLAQGLAALGLQGVGPNSLNLGALSPRSWEAGGLSFWFAGNVRFGTQDANSSRFTTDGITVGADLKLSDRLSVGAGVSYARDRSQSLDDDSSAKAEGSSIAAYGSYQPLPGTFLDAVLGYGVLSYDNQRFVSAIGELASSHRRGDQFFGSLTAAYEFRAEGFLFSPYGRVAFAHTRLDSVTERGVGAFALNLGEQSATSRQIAFGLRAEATHQTDFGLLLPHARVEAQYGVDRDGSTVLHYADQLNGTGYSLGATTTNRHGVVFGLGSDLVFWNGLKLSIDYQTLRSPGGENSQAVALRITKELDGPGLRAGSWDTLTMPRLGISMDAGVTFDDNVSRAEDGQDKISDESYNVNLGKRWNITLGSQTRAVVNAFFGGEKFHRYSGLGHLTLGGQAEIQYRSSGDFLAPTLGLFTRLSGEDYQSSMRDGYRTSTGVSIRQPVTDRINLFGALAYNTRNAHAKVFDTRDVSARVNLDYAVTATSSLYLTGEVRRGDVVSSGQASLKNLDMATAFAPDDVFASRQLYDYRFRGRTFLTTLGYSLPLGPTDAIDLSWRRVQSQPLHEPPYVTSATRYYVDQISFSYLTRF